MSINRNSKCSHGVPLFDAECVHCELVWNEECLRQAYADVVKYEAAVARMKLKVAEEHV
jgi:hypothetical protein